MENDEYNPVEPNYYNYKVKDNLTNKMQYNINSYENVYICSYNVNNDGKYPFLRFLLTNSSDDEKLVFPKIFIFKDFFSDELINYSKVHLFKLLMLSNYEKFNETIEFNGFYEFETNLYLFFDMTNCEIQINDIYINNNLWLTLIDEIVNYKHLCGMLINSMVTDFFIENEKFCFLVDDSDENYEIPIVSYVAKPENRLNFTYIFGETKGTKNDLFGAFYYFTNYLKSFDNAKELKMKNPNLKSGIVRFAIFVGLNLNVTNSINEKSDTSETKKQRLQDDNLDQNIERLTMRITDHDGNWADENYDSVYLGCVELDNGKNFDKEIIAVKDYCQQIPLSYHYINHKNDEYSIM